MEPYYATSNEPSKLTEKDKIWLGLKKQPKVIKDTTKIVIPVHYTSRGVMWETRTVNKNTLDELRAQHPNMEVIE